MKTFACVSVLFLVACGGSQTSNTTIYEYGSGGKAGSDSVVTDPSAGSPDEPMGVAGSGIAGQPDKVSDKGGSGNAGSPSVAGMGSAGKDPGGVAGQPNGGSGNAGAPSAGSPSNVAGSGGSDSAGSPSVGGTGGSMPFTGNECDATGRVGDWTDPVYNWDNADGADPSNGKSAQCTQQVARMGKAALDLSVPDSCAWETDPSDASVWNSTCLFTDYLVCQPVAGSQYFRVKVSSRVTNGNLAGQITYDNATDAGGCKALNQYNPAGLSVNATRN